MPINCTVNNAGCTVCPGISERPSSPAQVVVTPRIGWDAGANSVQTLTGNVRLAFTVGAATAMVVGLREVSRGRGAQTVPARIKRGWRVRVGAGRLFADVYEAGASRTPSYPLDPCEVLEVLRDGDAVMYRVGGELVHTTMNLPWNASAALLGPVFVTACLYTTGDVLAPHECPVD